MHDHINKSGVRIMLYINILVNIIGLLIGTACCFLSLAILAHAHIILAALVALVYAGAGAGKVIQSLRS